jgi:MOSC domain-containing protein YiiM
MTFSFVGGGGGRPILSCHRVYERDRPDTTAPPENFCAGIVARCEDARMASVLSVNVGLPRLVDFETSSLPESAIEKHPVDGPVRITTHGVEGNACADTVNHGDEYMRVYAYSREDYQWWEDELATPLPPGRFAEQLTTEGIDLNAAEVGETWRVGTATLQIAHVRIPCQTFKGWMGRTGHDTTAWVRRFALAGRPGPYLRVLEEGVVAAGDPIAVLDRPGHGVTVATMFRALMLEPALLPDLLLVDDLKPWVRRRALEAAGASREAASRSDLPD